MKVIVIFFAGVNVRLGFTSSLDKLFGEFKNNLLLGTYYLGHYLFP